MALVDLDDPQLTTREREILERVRAYALNTLRPVGVELDQMPDPAQAIAEGSPLWRVFEEYQALELPELFDPNCPLEPDEIARLKFRISEILGWGDSGLAISLTVAGFPRLFGQLTQHPGVLERYGGDDYQEIGCWAITEPKHGSDTILTGEPHFNDPRIRGDLIARRDGDDYVLSGEKSLWVSNGTIATASVLFLQIDDDKGMQHGGVCVLPLHLDGITRSAPLDKMGQRPLNQGQIRFDNVRVPAEYMVVGPDTYATMVDTILTLGNTVMSAVFTGCAQAAFDAALAFAKERVQGGKVLFDHQTMRWRLFDMFTKVEAARSLARRTAHYNNTSETPMLHYATAAKAFVTQTAFEVASEAVQIYGGRGLAKDYPVEKLLRDARASMIEDGTNEVLSIAAAASL